MIKPTRKEIAKALFSMEPDVVSSLVDDTLEVLGAIVDRCPDSPARSAANTLHRRLCFEIDKRTNDTPH